MLRISTKKHFLAALVCRAVPLAVPALVGGLPAFGADLTDKPEAPSWTAAIYDWTGLYVGGHFGYAWGKSSWTAFTPGAQGSNLSGSFSLGQPVENFGESGSFFEGFQIGYNRVLPDGVVIGAEADASFPAFPDPAGLSLGGGSNLSSRSIGAASYGENVFASGTLRARLGYAPGSWLFYATGGLAWTDDQFTFANLASGTANSSFLFRLGWTAGAGVEAPIAPHWSAQLQYLYKDYGASTVSFPPAGQRFTSDLTLQEVRLGLNYRFDDSPDFAKDTGAFVGFDPGRISLHGQFTGTWQGYGPIRSPFSGTNSYPGGGLGRETTDATLYAGFRLWQGAELWIDPEIDQGFGLANTHGSAGFASAEAYKLGQDYPYARVQRYFIRQTVNLGGETEKVEDDINQFAGTRTADRLVLTMGRFSVADIFDTNKYANSPKTDFLNWASVNAGTFDYAADAWGYTYGAAAEWYRGRYTLRAGIFDLSRTPTGGMSPFGFSLDPAFTQFQLVGEIEERHDLWGEPGKLKVTGFLSRGRAGEFADAIALAEATPGQPAGINAVRKYDSRPGVSVNLEQDVTDTVGVFARTGWADGHVESWDFTDIDRTVQGGVSVSGKLWGRPDDRIGVSGIINGISSARAEFLNLGGLGILTGDGQLPHPGLEKILEAYYSYTLTSSAKLTFDYQFIDNPAYNTDRGPVNLFAGRVHWQF